jgi:integrase
VTGADESILASTAIEKYLRSCEGVGLKDLKQRRYRAAAVTKAWKGRLLDSIRHRDVAEFLLELQAKGNSGSTVRRYYAFISAFFSWACANDYLATSPIRRHALRLPPENDPRTRRLNVGEEAQIRAHADQFLNDVMTVALQTGLRLGSILKIQVVHIHRDVGRFGAILLPASRMKQKKPQLVALTAELREIVDRRQAALRATGQIEDAFLFGDRRSGEPFKTRIPVEWRWRKALQAAGITGLRFHDLRGEAASRLVDSGAPVTVVQRFLGHSTLMMTERYLRQRATTLDESVLQLEALVTRGVEKAHAVVDPTCPSSDPAAEPSPHDGPDGLTTPPATSPG